MPITNGAYVSPNWANNTSPYINAAELNAISDTLVRVPIANGGTGAITAAAALTNLGAVPASSVTSKGSANTPVYFNSSGVATPISNPIPVSLGGTGATTVSAARQALGLGATSGALPISNGGTGQVTAANALTALGAEPKANVTSKGSVSTPVYFDSNGVATPISSPLPVSLGGTGVTTLSALMSASKAVVCQATNMGSTLQPIYVYHGETMPSTANVGSANRPMYMHEGSFVAMGGALSVEYGGTGAASVTQASYTGASNKITVGFWQWGKLVCIHVQGFNIAGTSTTTASNIIPASARPDAVGQVGCMTCGTDVGAYARCVVKNNGDVDITPNTTASRNYNVTMTWLVK